MWGIQRNIDRFAAVGATPIAISVDPPEDSRKLFEEHGIEFLILSDPTLETIRRYDLVQENTVEEGISVARPDEFLIDSSGIVRWLNLNENYWVRGDIEEIILNANNLL